MNKTKTAKTVCGIMMAGAVMCATTACKKDQFDPDIYNQVVTGLYPIDNIDAQHDWSLLTKQTVGITPGADGVARVQILTGDPFAQEGVEIIDERFASQDRHLFMTFKAPNTLTQYYAAAVTADGRYAVVPFGPADSEVTISATPAAVPASQQPRYIAYTYLYEADFPVPGDFDYNDVVMRVRKWASTPSEMKVEVTLVAAGTQKQTAAALHVLSLAQSQVESVTIDEGTRFDEGYPFQRIYIESNKTMMQGRNGDLVINLFEDAHWSLNRQLLTQGTVYHVPTNTLHEVELLKSDTTGQVTRTFTIRLKEGTDATAFTLADLDPFIIEAYNSKQFEVHTYAYKFHETLWQYYGGRQSDYNDLLAWAIMVPSSTFRYPLESIALCTFRNGVLVGAYSRLDHSFGEWGHDHTTATDWWLHPTGQVY